jgi:hypothetical protein
LSAEFRQKLLQLRVFRFRSDEDGNVGVGIFPQNEEVLVCLPVERVDFLDADVAQD